MFLCQLRCDMACYVPEFCSFSPTKGGKVPVDGLTIEDKLEGVHPVLFWFVFAVSTLGVLMAIAFLIFNVYNQNVRWGFNVKVEAEAVTVIPVNFRISSSSLANQTGRFQGKWIVEDENSQRGVDIFLRFTAVPSNAQYDTIPYRIVSYLTIFFNLRG